MSQMADANHDHYRMVRIAIAHLERAKTTFASEWEWRMVDTAIFNAKRVLPEHVSEYELELQKREGVNR